MGILLEGERAEAEVNYCGELVLIALPIEYLGCKEYSFCGDVDSVEEEEIGEGTLQYYKA